MISLERCREIIGIEAATLTDRQIEDIRDSLYTLARIAVRDFLTSTIKKYEPTKQ